MHLRLTIQSYPAASKPPKRSVILNERGGTIGRFSDCDLILPDIYVSRVHASILFVDGAFHLRNESMNGVRLSNGHQLLEPGEAERLQDGFVLQIGEFILGVEISPRQFEPDILDLGSGATYEEFDSEIAAPDAAAPFPAPSSPAQASPDPPIDDPFELGDDHVAVFCGDASIDTAKPKASDAVDVAVFGPSTLPAGRRELIDVWMFGRGDFDAVKRLATEMARGRNFGHKAGLLVRHGAIVHLTLSMPGVDVIVTEDSLVWTGQPANVSFVVETPMDADERELVGTVFLSIDGIRLGKVTFIAPVTPDEGSQHRPYERDFERIRTAFASYANEDRSDVLARLQGMHALSPALDVFLDVLTLRAGEKWEARLREEVPNRDAFYLFWSQHAAVSIWVAREWQLALDMRGLDYIVPVPLQNPAEAPPPKALNRLNFNDAYLAHIAYLKLLHESQHSNV